MAHFAGRYERFEQLGRGHFARVYRAHDHNLGLDVALKLFKNGTDIDEATYEAKTLIAVRGPHILPVLNADKYQDVPFIVTEIAPAGTTADQIGPHGVVPALAIRWIRDALVGLSVCHQHRLLHRDVKISNIFLRTEDEALLGDLGLAAAVDANGYADPHGFYSIRAPEAYSDGRVDVRSDLYSVGHALYHLLSGADPFYRASEALTKNAVMQNKYEPLRHVAPHVPRTLAKRVAKALALDPADRYASSMEFHSALADFDAFPISWSRIPAHPGHDRCWFGANLVHGLDVSVCVTRASSGFEIETRKVGGANHRIAGGCGRAANEGALGVFLRRNFDRLD